MKLHRIGHHRGYYEVERTPLKPRKPSAARPRRPSKTARAAEYAERIWRRYGDFFGDWAVSGMDKEEIDRFIGGGDRRLNKQAKDNIEDGISDAMYTMRVPLELAQLVRRQVMKLSHWHL